MTDRIEIHYDEHGVEKSVVVPHEHYLALLSAKDETDELKNRLNQILFILSDFLPEPGPAEPGDIEAASTQDFDETAELTENNANDMRDVRYYQRARGYYVDSIRFCVLAGSKARGTPSQTFDNIESLSSLRDRLIAEGILSRQNEWSDYEFTRDFTFGSPSAAASIVDGNSRSGPESWGRPRIA